MRGGEPTILSGFVGSYGACSCDDIVIDGRVLELAQGNDSRVLLLIIARKIDRIFVSRLSC